MLTLDERMVGSHHYVNYLDAPQIHCVVGGGLRYLAIEPFVGPPNSNTLT